MGFVLAPKMQEITKKVNFKVFFPSVLRRVRVTKAVHPGMFVLNRLTSYCTIQEFHFSVAEKQISTACESLKVKVGTV